MLYFLDTDPQRAARFLADVDVHDVSAVDEVARVMKHMRLHISVTAGEPSLLDPWVTRCQTNWDWTITYLQEIVNEHIFRFGRLHPGVRRFGTILELDNMVRRKLPRAGSTIPPLAFKSNCPDLCLGALGLMAVSHITFWRWHYGAARRGAIYTKRSVPEFIEERRMTHERRMSTHKESHDRRHEQEVIYGDEPQARIARVGGGISEGEAIRIRRVRPAGKNRDDP